MESETNKVKLLTRDELESLLKSFNQRSCVENRIE